MFYHAMERKSRLLCVAFAALWRRRVQEGRFATRAPNSCFHNAMLLAKAVCRQVLTSIWRVMESGASTRIMDDSSGQPRCP